MKTIIFTLFTFLSLASYSTETATTHIHKAEKKKPFVLEVTTNYTTIEEALKATKLALMGQKFIAQNGTQETSFTAKRTTGSTADYYIADVLASKTADGSITISITFMKIGSGVLKLEKTAHKVKAELDCK